MEIEYIYTSNSIAVRAYQVGRTYSIPNWLLKALDTGKVIRTYGRLSAIYRVETGNGLTDAFRGDWIVLTKSGNLMVMDDKEFTSTYQKA